MPGPATIKGFQGKADFPLIQVCDRPIAGIAGRLGIGGTGFPRLRHQFPQLPFQRRVILLCGGVHGLNEIAPFTGV